MSGKKSCQSLHRYTIHPHLHPSTPPSRTQTHFVQTSLLKIAIATVCTDVIGCEPNILFDESAQRSFITCTLANQLGLQTLEREDIHLSAFSTQISAVRQLSVATVNVVTTSGEKISTHVLVVDKIGTPLQNHLHQNVQDLPYLRGETCTCTYHYI